MTDDMKKNILNYVTNNVTQTNPQERYSFLETQILSSDSWTTDMLPTNYTEFNYTGIIAPNENTSNLSVMYGYYYDNTANKYKGIITLLNENFEPIKSFFQYDSETDLQPILGLEQASDNTFYGVDAVFQYNSQDLDPAQVVSNRFIMLNNFVTKNSNGEYQLTLRKTYNFSSNYIIRWCDNLYKNPNSAHYIIFGSMYQNQSWMVKVIDLKVNVGEPNEWSLKSLTPPSGDWYETTGKPVVLFNEDDEVFWRVVISHFISSSFSTAILCFTKDYSTTTTTTQTLISGSNLGALHDYLFKTQNLLFFGISNYETSQEETILYKYDFTSDSLIEVKQTALEEGYSGGIKLSINNSEIYVCFYSYFLTDNTGTLSFTRLQNDNFTQWFNQETYERSDVELFFAKSNYNLVSIVCVLQKWYSDTYIPPTGYVMKDNYNSLNYNGLQYTDYNSMIPEQGTLYSNGSLVFARNLSDSTILDNTTTSTMVVPNSYLNDTVIDTQNLLSETNSTMVNSTNSITKNVYETAYFNFINSINAIDNNYNNNQLISGTGAYVNSNINVGTQDNCSNSYIGKLVVNYEDGTSMTTGLVWTKTSDTTAMAEFALEVNTAISTIEYKSNDLTTTYLTEVPQNIEVGKTYKFTQYLKIE